MAGSTDDKPAMAHQHLELVDSNDDAHHRNNTGKDATELQGYWNSWRLIGSVLAITLMAEGLFIGYAMPVNVLSVINADIGPSPNIYLVTTCFTLTSGVLLLVVGRVSDIVGRRYFFIGGQLIGLIGSIVCAKANSVNTLIAGTVLIGIAGAGQQLYTLLLAELLPNKYRVIGQGVITGATLPTLGFAPLVARVFVEKTALGWRWCYWANVICVGFSLIFFVTCYFPPNFGMINAQMTKMQELKELDYGGLLLYSTGLILLMLGFIWAEGTYPWKSAHVISTLILGALVLVAFGIYETYMPLKQPLLPLRLFKQKMLLPIIICGCAGQSVYYALNILFPQQITILFTTDNILIGLMSSTVGASLAMGELIFCPLLKMVGHPKWQLVVASVGCGIFCALMAVVTENTMGMAVAFATLTGLMVGWIEVVAITVATLIVPPNDIGASAGFFAGTRAVTGTIAASIYVAVYSSKLTAFLPQEIVPAVEQAGLPSSSITALFTAMAKGTASAFAAVPGFNSAVQAALTRATQLAYMHAFKIVYLLSILFTGMGIIAAFFVTDIDEYMTSYVNKTIHKPGKADEEIAEVEKHTS